MATGDEGLEACQNLQPGEGEATHGTGDEGGEDQELPLPYELDEDGKPTPLEGVQSLFLTGKSLGVSEHALQEQKLQVCVRKCDEDDNTIRQERLQLDQSGSRVLVHNNQSRICVCWAKDLKDCV